MKLWTACSIVTMALGTTSSQTLAQRTPTDTTLAARRARMRAALEEARLRAEAGAARVDSIAVSPAHLDFQVGDSIYIGNAWARLKMIGLTAAGDTVSDFAKFFALKPNPYLELRGSDLLARRPGAATLWIYIGADPTRRLFVDGDRVTRVELRVH